MGPSPSPAGPGRSSSFLSDCKGLPCGPRGEAGPSRRHHRTTFSFDDPLSACAMAHAAKDEGISAAAKNSVRQFKLSDVDRLMRSWA